MKRNKSKVKDFSYGGFFSLSYEEFKSKLSENTKQALIDYSSEDYEFESFKDIEDIMFYFFQEYNNFLENVKVLNPPTRNEVNKRLLILNKYIKQYKVFKKDLFITELLNIIHKDERTVEVLNNYFCEMFGEETHLIEEVERIKEGEIKLLNQISLCVVETLNLDKENTIYKRKIVKPFKKKFLLNLDSYLRKYIDIEVNRIRFLESLFSDLDLGYSSNCNLKSLIP